MMKVRKAASFKKAMPSKKAAPSKIAQKSQKATLFEINATDPATRRAIREALSLLVERLRSSERDAAKQTKTLVAQWQEFKRVVAANKAAARSTAASRSKKHVPNQVEVKRATPKQFLEALFRASLTEVEPAKKAATPAKRAAAPAKKAAPVKKAAAPAKKAAAPSKKVAAPAKKAVAPAKKVAAPVKKAAAPAKKSAAPVKWTAAKKAAAIDPNYPWPNPKS